MAHNCLLSQVVWNYRLNFLHFRYLQLTPNTEISNQMGFNATKLLILGLIALLFTTNLKGQGRDFKSIKTPYTLNTQLTDKLDEFIKGGKSDEALGFIDEQLPTIKLNHDYEVTTYFLERKAYLLKAQNFNNEALLAASEAVKTAKTHLPEGHFLLAKSYYRKGHILHKVNNYYDAASNLDSAQYVYSSSSNYDSALYNSIVEYKYYAYSYGSMSVDTLVKYLDLRMTKELSSEQVKPNKVLYIMNDFPQLYMQKADYSQALAYAIEEVAYARENKGQIEKQQYLEARFNLALVLYYLRDAERGLKICNETLIETEDIYDFFGEVSQVERQRIRASRINIKGLKLAFLLDLKRYDDVIVEVENIVKETEELSYKFTTQQYITLAYSYLEEGEYDKASMLLKTILSELRPSFPNIQGESAFRVAGELKDKLHEPLGALMYYDSAIRNSVPEYYKEDILAFPSLENDKLPIEALFSLSKKTTALNKVYQQVFKDSLLLSATVNNYVSQTHALIMKSRQELIRTEGRLFLSRNFKSLYEAGIESAYQVYKNHDEEEGILAASRFFKLSKALLYLEQQGEFSSIQNPDVPQNLRYKFYQFKKDVNTLSERFYNMLDSASPTSDSVAVINRLLLSVNDSLSEVKREISELVDDDNFNISLVENELERLSLTKGQAVIEYFVGEEYIFVLAQSLKGHFFEKFIIDEQFRSNIEGLITEISHPPSFVNYSEKLNHFTENSYFLYQKLLEKALSKLGGGITHLTIIPDEYLGQIPFEVLLDRRTPDVKSFKDLPYLIKKYTVNYNFTSVQKQNRQNTERAPKKLLGIGFSTNVNGTEFRQLPGTDRELNFLQSRIEGTYYQGGTGTKEVFLSEAGNYDIIHLAIHGVAGSDGYESSLIFNGEDGVLKTSDLYLAGLRARLAVLSACESGLGELNKGEGAFSIARGFSIVGVPSVLMSLWSVNDQVTAQQMVDMHQTFLDGAPINEAIAQTKKNYISTSDNYTSHPYYWAAFISLGEPIELDDKMWSWQLWAFLLMFISTIFFLIIYYHKKRKEII